MGVEAGHLGKSMIFTYPGYPAPEQTEKKSSIVTFFREKPHNNNFKVFSFFLANKEFIDTVPLEMHSTHKLKQNIESY